VSATPGGRVADFYAAQFPPLMLSFPASAKPVSSARPYTQLVAEVARPDSSDDELRAEFRRLGPPSEVGYRDDWAGLAGHGSWLSYAVAEADRREREKEAEAAAQRVYLAERRSPPGLTAAEHAILDLLGSYGVRAMPEHCFDPARRGLRGIVWQSGVDAEAVSRATGRIALMRDWARADHVKDGALPAWFARNFGSALAVPAHMLPVEQRLIEAWTKYASPTGTPAHEAGE
jgi:hypothetical protein